MSFKLSIGKLAIIKEPLYINEAIFHFSWKTNGISNKYIYYYLSSINIQSFGSRAAKGITLNKDSLNSIVIELPCIEEQNKIANFLSAVDKKINIEENRLNLLRDQKQAFIQQMFIQ